MPKLKNRLPKLCKNGNYAFVRYLGQKISLGRWGTPESKQAYARFITNLQNNPGDVPRPLSGATADNQGGLVSELVARYLDYVKSSGIDKSHYTHCHILLTDFVLPYYGDILADEFSPKCLKFVRDRMIESKRFCRRVINDYASRIISMFSYGIEEELCQHQTVATLREVRSLKEGAKGTFDHPPVEPVPDDVIRRTLPFLTRSSFNGFSDSDRQSYVKCGSVQSIKPLILIVGYTICRSIKRRSTSQGVKFICRNLPKNLSYPT